MNDNGPSTDVTIPTSPENKSKPEASKLHPKHLGEGYSAFYDGYHLILSQGGMPRFSLNPEQMQSLTRYIELIYKENHR